MVYFLCLNIFSPLRALWEISQNQDSQDQLVILYSFLWQNQAQPLSPAAFSYAGSIRKKTINVGTSITHEYNFP